MKRIFIDVETDGVDPEVNSIIEIAVLFENGTEESRDVFHKFICPEKKCKDFDEISKKSHGITWEWLVSEKQELEIFKEFVAWLDSKMDKFDKQDRSFFIAYNAKFDNQFIYNMFVRHEIPNDKNNAYYGSYFRKGCAIDIIPIVAATVESGMLQVPENFKNPTIAKLLEIPLDNAHSALDDIKASRQIYIKCLQLLRIKKSQKEAVNG